MSLFDKLRHLGAHAASELASAHLKTQVLRVVRLTVFALLAQVAATGGENLGWKTLAALAVGAAEAAVRTVWPAFPAQAVVSAVKGAVSSAPPAPAASSTLTSPSVTSASPVSSSTAAASVQVPP